MDDSPFLPDTNIQFAWDSTSLGYLKTCPRLYQYIMIEGWRPKEESVHLRFGREYHTALEQYDTSRNNGVKHEDAVHDVVRELLFRTADYNPSPDNKAGRYKSKFNLLQLVIDYLDKFESDPARTVILNSGKPATELSFRFELDFGPKMNWAAWEEETQGHSNFNYSQPYLLCGHLDRVVEFNGANMVMDRKTTTSTLSQYYFDQYEPDNQMTLYTIAGKVVLGSPVKGVIVDAAQIMLTEPNVFVRGFTYRTPDQCDEWLVDLQITLQTAEAYARANYWPMNDKSCNHYRSEDKPHGGCPFRTVCCRSSQVRRSFLKADFVQLPPEERWNPLRVR